jgi:hypothetical protein
MRFDDDASKTPSDTPAAAEPGARARRRSSRPWSNTAPPGERTTFDRPISDADWSAPTAGGRPRPPIAPPVLPSAAPPDSGAASGDLAQLVQQLTALQAQVTALQAAVEAPPPAPDAALVTGAELAASIEALGTALGGGMATLLTEHRNLLARDVSGAADHILEELGVRLRAATTQNVDSGEERTRHVVTRSIGELTEQIDLRLDKIQADVSGLRAVMLEIPDQSAVTDRLDQLSETLATARPAKDGGRMSPAVASAIEKSVTGPLEHLEASVHSVVEVVRELLDERLPEDLAESIAGVVEGGGSGIDSATIEALTTEITALKRRISLRPQIGGAAAPAVDEEPVEEDEDDDDDLPVIEVEAPPAPTAAKTTRTTKAAKAAAKPRGRRGRQIT